MINSEFRIPVLFDSKDAYKETYGMFQNNDVKGLRKYITSLGKKIMDVTNIENKPDAWFPFISGVALPTATTYHHFTGICLVDGKIQCRYFYSGRDRNMPVSKLKLWGLWCFADELVKSYQRYLKVMAEHGYTVG